MMNKYEGYITSYIKKSIETNRYQIDHHLNVIFENQPELSVHNLPKNIIDADEAIGRLEIIFDSLNEKNRDSIIAMLEIADTINAGPLRTVAANKAKKYIRFHNL